MQCSYWHHSIVKWHVTQSESGMGDSALSRLSIPEIRREVRNRGT